MICNTCKVDIGDGPYVTSWTSETDKTYSCWDCDLLERIREYGSDGVIRTSLYMDAAMRAYKREYIKKTLSSRDSTPREIDTVRDYGRALAKNLVAEETAFRGSPPDHPPGPDVYEALKRIAGEQPRAEHGPRISVGTDLYDIERVFCGFWVRRYQFWFDVLCESMEPVEALVKTWEREVWFGGHDYSMDSAHTEPYAENMPEFRSYIRDEKGIRLEHVPPGSLQAFVLAATMKGYSAKVGDVTYSSYTVCKRSLFQIESGPDRLTLILDEDSPMARGGIQGISATAKDAHAMLTRAIEDWKSGKIQLAGSTDMGVM